MRQNSIGDISGDLAVQERSRESTESSEAPPGVAPALSTLKTEPWRHCMPRAAKLDAPDRHGRAGGWYFDGKFTGGVPVAFRAGVRTELVILDDANESHLITPSCLLRLVFGDPVETEQTTG